MAQFAENTRKWLESIIRQRKMLIRAGKSHKSADSLLALDKIDRLLKTYSYAEDRNMAVFIHQNYGNISTILPGKGSSCYIKKQCELKDIQLHATLIISEGIEFKQLSKPKTLSYELEF